MTATVSELESLLAFAQKTFRLHQIRCIVCLVPDYAAQAGDFCEVGRDLRHRVDVLKQRIDEQENGGPLIP